MILVLFKPLKTKEQEFVDVPLLEMSQFVMYELNGEGLQTLMTGENSLRYADRYLVNEIDFTDNSKKFISNMKADSGLYKNEIMNLKGNITYIREDGLEIQSKSMTYNTKTYIAQTDERYEAWMGENKILGDTIRYDAKNKKIEAKKIAATYILQESE